MGFKKISDLGIQRIKNVIKEFDKKGIDNENLQSLFIETLKIGQALINLSYCKINECQIGLFD